MFDLEQSLAEWRRQMGAAGIKSPVPLEELESHLREEIERLTGAGLRGSEAFVTAVQKIGPAPVVQAEFEKARGLGAAHSWRPKQIIFVAGLGAVSMFILVCLLFKLGSFSQITPAQQLSGLAATAVMLLLAGGGPLAGRFFPVIHSRPIRDAIGIFFGLLVMLWYAVFASVILPLVEGTLGQLIVIVLWSTMVPTGVFGGLIAGIETAARRKTALAGS